MTDETMYELLHFLDLCYIEINFSFYWGFADNNKHVEKVGTQDGAIVNEQ